MFRCFLLTDSDRANLLPRAWKFHTTVGRVFQLCSKGSSHLAILVKDESIAPKGRCGWIRFRMNPQSRCTYVVIAVEGGRRDMEEVIFASANHHKIFQVLKRGPRDAYPTNVVPGEFQLQRLWRHWYTQKSSKVFSHFSFEPWPASACTMKPGMANYQ